MLNYQIDFEYMIKEFGVVELPATNIEDAKFEAQKYIQEFYPDVIDVKITEVKEIV